MIKDVNFSRAKTYCTITTIVTIAGLEFMPLIFPCILSFDFVWTTFEFLLHYSIKYTAPDAPASDPFWDTVVIVCVSLSVLICIVSLIARFMWKRKPLFAISYFFIVTLLDNIFLIARSLCGYPPPRGTLYMVVLILWKSYGMVHLSKAMVYQQKSRNGSERKVNRLRKPS